MKSTNKIEQRILSILMFKDEYMNETELKADIFQYKANQNLFMIMNESYIKNKKIDLLLIAEKLNESKLLDYALKIQDSYVSSSTFYSDLEVLTEHKTLKDMKVLLDQFENDSIDFEELKSEIKKIDTLLVKNTTNELTVDEIMELITSNDIQLNFNRLRKLNEYGIQRNALHVIGARTGIGKSAFALNVLDDLSSTYRCVYFNMEMTQKETLRRIVSMNVKIPTNKYNNLNLNDKSRVYDTLYKIKREKQINIINGSQTIGSIRKIVSRESRDTHLIVFIDYVGLIKDRRYQNITQRVTEITKELQIMTKDFDCTIFMLAQINRQGANNDMPKMEHLKDSGEIEQSANTLMLLHRVDKDINKQIVNYSLIIPKNRHPKTGIINLIFNKDIQLFCEV